jgi:hypothetical protein
MPDKPKPPGFVLLQTEDRVPIYIAIDEVARFTPYDRYHPGGTTTLIMNDGDRIHIRESVDEIATLMIQATTTYATGGSADA